MATESVNRGPLDCSKSVEQMCVPILKSKDISGSMLQHISYKSLRKFNNQSRSLIIYLNVIIILRKNGKEAEQL